MKFLRTILEYLDNRKAAIRAASLYEDWLKDPDSAKPLEELEREFMERVSAQSAEAGDGEE